MWKLLKPFVIKVGLTLCELGPTNFFYVAHNKMVINILLSAHSYAISITEKTQTA